MKKLITLFLVTTMIYGCSSVQLVDSYKDPDVVIFHAFKVLVVGLSQDDEARVTFESMMVEEFLDRDVEAMRSIDIFDVEFTSAVRSEEELDEVEQQLLDKDFDAILFSKVVGVENHRSIRQQVRDAEDYYQTFSENYLWSRNQVMNQEMEQSFPIYHVETSLYCICPGKKRQLIWRVLIDITDPKDMKAVVKDYVQLLLTAMEEEDIIIFKPLDHETTSL